LRVGIQRVLFIVVLIIIGYLVIPPLFFTFRESLHFAKGFQTPEFSFKNYTDVFSFSDTPKMIFNSFWFSIGSSVIGLIMGTLLAWIVERTNTPFKKLAYLSAFLSLGTPLIIRVIGWILLTGPEAGLINVGLRNLLGLERSPCNIFTMTGMILIQGLFWSPVVFLFMSAPFRSMDPSLEESASMSGAGVAKTFYHITFKLARPSVLAVLLLTFIRTIESFEIPALIGIPSGIRVLTTEIFLKITSGLIPQYGLASAYAIILIFFVSVGLYFYSRATREAQRFSTITGKGFRPRLTDIGKWRYLTTGLIFIFPILMSLPFLALLWASFLPYYMKPSFAALSSLTIANYFSAFKSHLIVDAIRNSVFISLCSATATMLLTAVTAWVVVRTNIRGKWLLDHLASFTLVFPGVVLGVALLVTYLTLPIPLYGTLWILVIAYITRYTPYGIRYCYPGLLQISKELEESAQMSGAPWGTVFRKIVVPLMMPSLFAGWIFIFLLSVRELSVAILLSRPGSQVIAVAIYDMWDDGEIVQIAAFSIWLTALLVAIAAGFYKLSTRYGLQTQQERV